MESEMEKQIRCKDWLVCVEDVPESFMVGL